MSAPPTESPPGLWTPFELVAAWFLGAVVAAGAVLWTSTQLAALVSSATVLELSVNDIAAALTQLPSTASDPAAAFSTAPPGTLPGPVAYWACVAVVLAILVSAVGVCVHVVGVVRRGRHPAGVEPNAGLARPADVRHLVVDRPQPGRLTLGTLEGRLVAAEAQVSLAVVGPSGCGKTLGFAIPALLEWDGPVICTSVKGDVVAATLTGRQHRGRCWVYDPTGAAVPTSQSWSPLADCVTWDGAIRIAAWLCEATQARLDSVTDGDYWYTQARKALAPYLHAAAVGGRSMLEVTRWIDSEEQDEIRDILRHAGGLTDELDRRRTTALTARHVDGQRIAIRAQVIAQLTELWQAAGAPEARLVGTPVHTWPHELQTRIDARVEAELARRIDADLETAISRELTRAGRLDALIAAEALWRKEDRLRGSVFATMQNTVAAYADPHIAASGHTNELDLDAWLDGPNTIYIVASAHEQARVRPVYSVVVQQAVRHAFDTANRHGGTLTRPCLVLLDEAGNIAPLRDLPTYASTARSHGISLVTVWQDLAQIRAIYDDRAQTVLNNHRAKIFGSGIADDLTLEYISRLVGDEERREQDYSADLGGGTRCSVSQHTAYRRLLPMDAVRRLRPFEALLVYGAELPAHLKLRKEIVAPTALARRDRSS
jgi:type IV secretion system protein VirD4